jgi:hypothetical protein
VTDGLGETSHHPSSDSSESSRSSTERESGSPPALTIVSGQPTPEETAAVVVVLTALAGHAASAPADPPTPSQWSARSRFMRAPVTPGPGAWRASALPR